MFLPLEFLNKIGISKEISEWLIILKVGNKQFRHFKSFHSTMDRCQKGPYKWPESKANLWHNFPLMCLQFHSLIETFPLHSQPSGASCMHFLSGMPWLPHLGLFLPGYHLQPQLSSSNLLKLLANRLCRVPVVWEHYTVWWRQPSHCNPVSYIHM